MEVTLRLYLNNTKHCLFRPSLYFWPLVLGKWSVGEGVGGGVIIQRYDTLNFTLAHEGVGGQAFGGAAAFVHCCLYVDVHDFRMCRRCSRTAVKNGM